MTRQFEEVRTDRFSVLGGPFKKYVQMFLNGCLLPGKEGGSGGEHDDGVEGDSSYSSESE